jgi:hypothetical protein
MEKCRQLNLPSIMPTYADSSGMLLPFVRGVSYDRYLRSGGISATKNVLERLILAHSMNVVYGDRWAKNTIIKPDESVVEIDFDIELTGEFAREFEFSQLLYHILLFSSRRSEILAFLADYLRDNEIVLARQYDFSRLAKFLANYTNHFQDRPDEGGIEREVAELIEILRSTSDLKGNVCAHAN